MQKLLTIGFLLVQSAAAITAQNPIESGSKELIWDAKTLNTIKIQHKHGTLRINGWEKDSVWLKTEILVDHKSASVTDEIRDEIQINSQVQKNTLLLTTKFSENFHSNYPFFIQFELFVPAHLQVTVKHELGKINLSNLPNFVDLDAEYTSITDTESAENKGRNYKLSYSKAQLSQSVNAELNVSHSTIWADNIKQLKINGEYNIVSLSQIQEMESKMMESNMDMDQIGRIKLEGIHLFVMCKNIVESGWFEMEKGSQQIMIQPSCKALNIANKNTKLTIEIPTNHNFTINGILKKSKLIHPFGSAITQLTDAQMNEFRIEPSSTPTGKIQLFNSLQPTTIKTY